MIRRMYDRLCLWLTPGYTKALRNRIREIRGD